jgi:hypothetical protein
LINKKGRNKMTGYEGKKFKTIKIIDGIFMNQCNDLNARIPSGTIIKIFAYTRNHKDTTLSCAFNDVEIFKHYPTIQFKSHKDGTALFEMKVEINDFLKNYVYK